jgi:hypothetical protein
VTTKLQVFNGALLLCGERFLSALTDNTEPRRLLDHVWDNGGVKTCLEEGQWFFAMRTTQVDYDTGVEPDFGLRRAFSKPTDWCLTSAMCSDEFFTSPLLRYVDEAGYWYSDLDTIYVRYISDDVGYGLDLLKWPSGFREFAEAHFASKVVHKISGSEEVREQVLKRRKDTLRNAKNMSLMAGPPAFPAPGTWTRSRNRYPNRRDGGNRGSLIG